MVVGSLAMVARGSSIVTLDFDLCYRGGALAPHVSPVRAVGLTGTGFTMSDGFYQRELDQRGLAVVLPAPEEQAEIHRIIYEELIVGTVVPTSVARFATIASHLAGRGAEAVLLACTELELLTRSGPLSVPALDTTKIHADAAWEVAVGRRSLRVMTAS